MKNRILRLFLSLLIAFNLIGCSLSENDKVEKALLDKGYYIDATEKGCAIKKYYDNRLGMRCWAYSSSSDNLIKFSDDYLLKDISIDPINGEICYNINQLDVSENIVSHLKEFSDEELSNIGITYEQMINYMKYKMEKSPNSVGDSNSLIKEHDFPTKIQSPKECLISNYPSDISSINRLSEEDAETYLKCYEDDNNLSFLDLQEKVFLEHNAPTKVAEVIKSLKLKSSGAKTEWSLENFATVQTEPDSAAAIYILYLGYVDSGLNVAVMYDPTTEDFNGIGLIATDYISDSMDTNDFIAFCALISGCVDISLDGTQAVKNILQCVDNPIEYNGYVYIISTESDQLSFMIYPKGAY